MIRGDARGDECARTGGGFDDEHAEGEAADDAVALGEVFGDWRGAEGELGDDGAEAFIHDLLEKGFVFGRIDVAEAATHDHKGSPFHLNG